ncbi:NADH-quinone oxidoreductase subunit NuoG [Lyticum sinuosum]|uniref:NADH-quinone oxidoreductase subunit G n=1 Tax=Lyticum sinuosum TaxID=1332059 RepID=A0AAE5AHB8_9RICK|nr:NADH-quinone oxidoreductase subunit NuoG [Lyticum sinuosum]MDZ5761385.1 NADH-quinone oxidoreductase subunit G [Lyticum sinuosum]
MSKIIININGNNYEFDNDLTIIQACDQIGIEIPRFCYHKNLKIAGNCRMCLVEVDGISKPVPSCLHKISNNTKISTNSDLVKKAREGVMEFLLINHPLDCPICDQAGECDLQNQAFLYGKGKSYYKDKRRIVNDKNMGPFISTHMTRCIHCLRCVRFMDDIAGSPEIGVFYRGEQVEISTILKKSVHSELSGNIIDLCPVGALNDAPSAYTYRPWELKKIKTIDICDSLGSAIYIYSKNNKIVKIKPSEDNDCNQGWISNKSRFSYDALSYQRITKPMIRNSDNHLVPCSWEDALNLIVNLINNCKIKSEKFSQNVLQKHINIAAISGDYTDLETIYSFKTLLDNLNCNFNYECRQRGELINPQNNSNYFFSNGINSIDEADYFLIIGGNMRYDAPLLNSRIFQNFQENKINISYFGENINSTYNMNYLGDDINVLRKIADGNHKECDIIRKSKKPIIILSTSAMQSINYNTIYIIVELIAYRFGLSNNEWNSINILPNTLGLINGLFLGFYQCSKNINIDNNQINDDKVSPIKTLLKKLCSNNNIIIKNHERFIKNKEDKDIDKDIFNESTLEGNSTILFLLGSDEIDLLSIPSNVKVIYIGHHCDNSANRADIILPSPAYTERNSFYLNLEGKLRKTSLAINPPEESKEEWEIALMIAKKLAIDIKWNNRKELIFYLINDNILIKPQMYKYYINLIDKNNFSDDNTDITDIKQDILIKKTKDHLDKYFYNDTIDKKDENCEDKEKKYPSMMPKSSDIRSFYCGDILGRNSKNMIIAYEYHKDLNK